MMSMEFGYWRGPNDDLDQKRCFEECFQAYSEHPWVIGMTWWIAFDYFGENYYNGMGVFNHARSWHSPVYFSMQTAYGNYTMNNL